MLIEIIITIIIIIAAGYIFWKNIKKRSTGSCDCGSCSTHCPNYKK